jgi:hypothetical protein
MIRIASQPKSATPVWHAGFLAMLPTIHAYARGAFAHLNPEARQHLRGHRQRPRRVRPALPAGPRCAGLPADMTVSL